MALTSYTSVKTLLGISSSDTSQDTLLDQITTAAIAAVKSYLRRGKSKTAFTSWPESGSDTIYMSGNDTPYLLLQYWPVTTLTSIYLDQSGYFGDGTNAFASTTLLTVGTDYVMVRDDGSASTSARVRRLGGLSSAGSGGDYGWSPGFGFFSSRGPLATGGRSVAVWPYGQGNIKVTYTAGYSTVPSDLSHATNMLAIFMYGMKDRGYPLQTESLADYSYSLMAKSEIPEIGSIRQLLSIYREQAV